MLKGRVTREDFPMNYFPSQSQCARRGEGLALVVFSPTENGGLSLELPDLFCLQ
jgi:hypothetical protein